MAKPLQGILLVAGCLLACPTASVVAQEPVATSNVVHVLGLEGVKKKTKGHLFVSSGEVRFEAGTAKAEVAMASIQDIFTNADNKRLIGGKLGMLTMFAPYESDRFLSLFRRGIDVLTLKYRDAKGALHGVIFILPKGQAPLVKKQMVAQGAHASIPVEEEGQKPDTKQERKP